MNCEPQSLQFATQAKQERVEVEKAAAYAVWKERNPDIKTPAESEAGNYKGEMQAYFLQQVERYRKMK